MAKLEELLRQRKLLETHLAWLDQEIAAAGAQASQDKALVPSAPPRGQPDFQPLSAPEKIAAAIHRHPVTPSTQPPEIPDSVTNEFLAQFEEQSKSSPAEAKKGCLILFGTVVGVLSTALLLIYFLKYY